VTAKRLPLLDALRGIAALAVMLHHESGLYGTHWPLPRAYLAVDFFFMLSGLVLTPVMEPRLRAGLGAERFVVQRLRRLWPVLAVGVSVGGLHALLLGRADAALLLLGGLMLVPMLKGAGGIYRLDGPQWSVSFELIANYAHARLLARLSDRQVLGVTLAMGATLAGLIGHVGSVAMGDVVANWWGGFARVGFNYALGVWMGRRLAASAPMRGGLLALLPVPLVLGLMPLVPLPVAWGDGLAVFLLLPGALWWAAHATCPAPAERAARWLGELSYPLYALHVPLLVIGAGLIHHAPPALWPELRAGAMVAVLACAAALARGLRPAAPARVRSPAS
jgi:peptidoglycan/LPS O-acetylase OafA/YrhL